MNYFELINKCLTELNYKTVTAFNELTKNDHKKIKNIINSINTEVCNSEKWNFLLRKTSITLPAKTSEITNPVKGRITLLSIDGERYHYVEDFEKFFTSSKTARGYTSFNDKLLFPVFEEDKTVDIIYYTSNCAKNADNEEKMVLDAENDESLIPEIFAEPLLVYGTCMRLKGNPQHIRFNYWYGMYKDALLNMRSKLSVDADAAPVVKLFRK